MIRAGRPRRQAAVASAGGSGRAAITPFSRASGRWHSGIISEMARKVTPPDASDMVMDSR
jgi:hypothetical protein